MDNAFVLFLLRAIHVVGGMLWVGGVVVVTLYLLPATQSVGPAAQPVMQFIMGRRKLSIYLMLIAIFTTLAGVLLMVRNMSLTDGVWARSPMGMGISAGAAAAILALIVGMSVNAPAARRMSAPPKPGAPPLTDQDRAALMRRIAFGSWTTMILLLIASLLMATARYF